MPRNEKTGKAVGKIASRALYDPKSITPRQIQKLAGSALTQRPDKRTSKSRGRG